jgi:hypothetical protein
MEVLSVVTDGSYHDFLPNYPEVYSMYFERNRKCDTAEGDCVWFRSNLANMSAILRSVCRAEMRPERQVSPNRSYRFTTLHGVTLRLCQADPTSSPNAMIVFLSQPDVLWRRVVWLELADVWGNVLLLRPVSWVLNMGQYVLPKRRYISTRLYCVTSQKKMLSVDQGESVFVYATLIS